MSRTYTIDGINISQRNNPHQPGRWLVDGQRVKLSALQPDTPEEALRVWTEAQNAPVETGPPPVPAEVSKLRLKRALRAEGLEPAFKAALAAASVEVQEDWADAAAIERADPLVTTFAGALGLTNEQVDDLFRAAAAQ